MVKKFYILFIISIITFSSYAQDIHFSQFYYSPLTLNPANTGRFDGDWRLSNIFRTQWGAVSKEPYNTISVGLDKRLKLFGRNFGAGIYFLNDNSGSADLTANKIMISLAYQTQYNGYKISGGIQLGFVNKKFNSKVSYPSQFDRNIGEFNPDLANNENDLNESTSYLDVNAGIIVSRKFGKIEPEFGYSLFHVTNPTEQFGTIKNRLPLRHIIHVGTKIDLSKKFFAKPRILYMNHKRAADMIWGVNFGYNLPQNNYYAKSVFFGPHIRTVLSQTDAIIFAVGLNFTNMDIGVSYDVNISSLNPATSHKGALEITLIYRSKNTTAKKIAIPCDRF